MSFRAWLDGVEQVLRAPLLLAAALLLTVAAALPFGMVLGGDLRESLAHQPPIDSGASEIDADWWSEFHAHADGLAATFTPTIIGFSAPLDNLSSLLDGTRRPIVLAIPVAIGIVVWAALWGIALRRFHLRRGLSLGEAVHAAVRALPRFMLISVAALAAQLLLFVTIHPLLFSILYPAFVGGLSEPVAFAVRVAFYLVFGIPLALIALCADYARVAQTVAAPASVGDMFAAGVTFVRRNLSTVTAVYLLTGVLFVLITAGYGVVDIVGGSRVGGWRGVALGQAFIVGRLIVRLLFGASEMALFKARSGQTSVAER